MDVEKLIIINIVFFAARMLFVCKKNIVFTYIVWRMKGKYLNEEIMK